MDRDPITGKDMFFVGLACVATMALCALAHASWLSAMGAVYWGPF